MHFKVLMCLVLVTDSIWCAQILGVLHVPMHSHHLLMDTIFKELAARGHNVTAITPYKENVKVENFEAIELMGSIEKFAEIQRTLLKTGSINPLSKYQLYETVGLELTEQVLANKNVQNLLKSDRVFDLIIIDHNMNEALKGFCHHYTAPCVSITTFAASRWSNPQMGNPGPPSYVPDILVGFTSSMSFLERFYNFFIYITGEIYTHIYVLPKHSELLQKYFPNAPHVYDVMYNTSLMLVNSHVSLNSAVPYVPNMIEIGGYHVSVPQKLPKDLQDFLDNANHGAIYFSLGSNIKMSLLPVETINGILTIFSKLKQKVLWKSEQETLQGQPDNVMLKEWLPQNDILAHPNIKVFITQGGQLSVIEAVYNGIPILGIPVFADQEFQMVNAVRAGYGVSLPFKKFNLKMFEIALNEILNNSTYFTNAKETSKIFHDRPMKPLDTAMYWIEYVLRHRGAPHLRTAALNLTWYQYLMLDVIMVLFIASLPAAVVSWSIIKFFIFRKRVDHFKKQN